MADKKLDKMVRNWKVDEYAWGLCAMKRIIPTRKLEIFLGYYPNDQKIFDEVYDKFIERYGYYV